MSTRPALFCADDLNLIVSYEALCVQSFIGHYPYKISATRIGEDVADNTKLSSKQKTGTILQIQGEYGTVALSK